MSFPSLDITTNKDGVVRGFLTCDEYKAKGLLHTARTVVDLVTMLAKSAQDKETLDWIGETFWAENEKLREQAGCLVDERDRLEAENEKAQTWVAEAQGKISALEGLLKEANTLYVDGQKALQDVFTANEDQIKGLVRETRCLRGDIDAGHQEILRLRNLLTEATHQIHSLESDNLALRAKILKGGAPLEDARWLINTLLNRLIG